jgi:hypothetical protein
MARGDLHALKLLSKVHEITMTFEALPPGLEAEPARSPTAAVAHPHDPSDGLERTGAPRPSLVSDLAARGHVMRVEVGGVSLEDVFVKLTAEQGGDKA